MIMKVIMGGDNRNEKDNLTPDFDKTNLGCPILRDKQKYQAQIDGIAALPIALPKSIIAEG